MALKYNTNLRVDPEASPLDRFDGSIPLRVGRDGKKNAPINQLIAQASKYEIGAILLSQHSRMAFGMQKDVNLWLRDKSPNWHLAMLVTLQFQLNWEGKINLITTTSEKEDERRLQGFLERISDRARLPSMSDFHVLVGSFKESLKIAPRADINIYGLDQFILYFCKRLGPRKRAGLSKAFSFCFQM